MQRPTYLIQNKEKQETLLEKRVITYTRTPIVATSEYNRLEGI